MLWISRLSLTCSGLQWLFGFTIHDTPKTETGMIEAFKSLIWTYSDSICKREILLYKSLFCFYYSRLRREKQARIEARKKTLEKKKARLLQEKFPHLSQAQKSSLGWDVWTLNLPNILFFLDNRLHVIGTMYSVVYKETVFSQTSVWSVNMTC